MIVTAVHAVRASSVRLVVHDDPALQWRNTQIRLLLLRLESALNKAVLLAEALVDAVVVHLDRL